MKKELKHILENGLSKELEQYLNDNKKLNYSFHCKIGDNSVSVNPFLFSLFFKPELAKIFIQKLDDLSIKDFTSLIPYPLKIASVFSNNKFSDKELNVIYQYLSKDQKESVNSTLKSLSLQEIENNQLSSFIDQKNVFNKILIEDDSQRLFDFIDKNPHFDYLGTSHKNSYLLTCIQHNSVFCFDILKDHIKSIKLSTKKFKP